MFLNDYAIAQQLHSNVVSPFQDNVQFYEQSVASKGGSLQLCIPSHIHTHTHTGATVTADCLLQLPARLLRV